MKVLFLDTNHPFLLEGLRKLDLECDEDYSSSKSAIEEFETLLVLDADSYEYKK